MTQEDKQLLLKEVDLVEVDLDKEARHYLLHEHTSPLSAVFHQTDLRIEMQYHKDIENAFKAGYELGLKAQKGEKIMAAPEKTYLYPSDMAGEEYEDEWGDKPWGKDYVEYTHIDAFIEKAEYFIYSALNDGIMGTANIEDFIRLFKKYMKGGEE